MPKFTAPDCMNFTKPSEWPEWKERFCRFRTATKMHEDTGEVQVSSIIYAMGPEAERVYKSFTFAQEAEKDDFNIVLAKFDEHFVPKRNIIFERAKFHQCNQTMNESVEAFVRKLYDLSEHCDFGPGKDEQIRDRLVIGLMDKSVSQRLQMKSDLTLQTAIEMARHCELVKEQNTSSLNSMSNMKMELDAIGDRSNGANYMRHGARPKNNYYARKSPSHGRGYQHNTNYNDTPSQKRCTRCNRKHKYGDTCPAIRVLCRKCNKPGHYAVCCHTKMIREVTGASANANINCNPECEQDYYFLGAMVNLSNTKESEPPWQLDLKIGNTAINFKIDSGADVTVISDDTYNTIQPQPELSHTNVILQSPGGKLDCKGCFIADIHHTKDIFSIPIYVVTGNIDHNLLSRTAAVQMGLIQRLDGIDSDVFGGIGILKGDPVHIFLRDDATPYAIHAARRVPIPLLGKVSDELQRMEAAGVIEKVTEPSDWCAPVVAVPKPNGQVRICVDLRQLNKAVKRSQFILPTLEDVLHKMSGSNYFSKLDATSGFYQIKLDEESRKLTTFITTSGRYRFKRLPFGISSACEIFSCKMTELLKDIEGVSVYIDDIFIYGSTIEQHDKILNTVINRIRESGLKLNKDKCLFRQKEIDILGHRVNSNGISPHRDKVRAIIDLEPPTNVTELRRVLGMVNYLGRYLPDLSAKLQPLNELLKLSNAWSWGPSQQKSFDTVKQMVSSAPVLALYDVNKPTMVCADASQYGIGGVIMQQHASDWKPVAFGSRTLTDTEKRFSQIDKECLASVWICEKFSRYLCGLEKFRLITDHKPLVPLINRKDIDLVPIRCQRFLMRLMRFNPIAEHLAGKKLLIADTLSRSPLRITTSECDNLELETQNHVDAIISSLPISDQKINKIKSETETLQTVVNYVRYGWPEYSKDIASEINAYYSVRDRLSEIDGLLVYGNRIVIPESMRSEILDRVHEGHQGLTKCRERVNQSVWWPKIIDEINNKVITCSFCQINRPNQRKEPLITTPLPERPWQKIAADLCTFKQQQYLVIVDYFSRYLEILHMSSTSSESVINNLKCTFARYGIPEILVTDNGPQFVSSAFQQFQNQYGMEHITTSPYFPQANGEAERAVQTAKNILRQPDPFLALLSYRATPIEATRASPAQLLMGRQLRTTLPTLPQNLRPKWPAMGKVRKADKKKKQSSEFYYNRRHGVKKLSKLRTGDRVIVKTDNQKNWSSSGIITAKCDQRRSFIVRTNNGTYRRNRCHLRVLHGDVSVEHPVGDEFVGLDLPYDDPEPPANYEPNACEPGPTINQQQQTTRSGRVIIRPIRYR